ncbi:MAG: condensation domain-containing protein, partial [Acutalibacteraceae bacterium]
MNLTKPQKLIYNMEKFTGGAVAVICGSMLLGTEKDSGELKTAINELYRINDALRMRITENGQDVSQYISEYAEQSIDILSFGSKAELDSFAADYAKVPIDLNGSLCEIKIVLLPEQCGILAKLHHLVGDAWTLSLLGSQLNSILSGQQPETFSYADYVEAEKKYTSSARYSKDKEYFLSQFKKCDEVTYISEKNIDSDSADRSTFVIPKEKASRLTHFAQEKNTSVFALFLTAVATYINRTKMNAENFCIGTAVLNRTGFKEKNTAGMFINTVPVLIELDNNSDFLKNLEAVEDSALSVLRHQKYNYGDLLEELRKNHNFSEKLYDVMISYQNAKVSGSAVKTTWYHSGMQTESLQIHIDDQDNEGVFRIHYDYQTEKFTEHEIDMLHQHICNLLFDAIEHSGKKLYELNILTADEKQKLLYTFNDTAVDYPRDKCVHQLFEEQVAKTPDKVAVIACDKTLTYRELNEEANRIAHSLIEKGVNVGDIVAFALPRKSYLIATMFGILKSGATYMPIDPTYPEDRIEYMLTESNAKCC